MQSSIDELLKQAFDYDNDKKFMAANDLCQELVKGTPFDSVTLEKICNVFIKHLDEPTSDIKGTPLMFQKYKSDHTFRKRHKMPRKDRHQNSRKTSRRNLLQARQEPP